MTYGKRCGCFVNGNAFNLKVNVMNPTSNMLKFGDEFHRYTLYRDLCQKQRNNNRLLKKTVQEWQERFFSVQRKKV